MFIQETLVKYQKQNIGRANLTRREPQINNYIKPEKSTNKEDKLPMQTQMRK